MVIRATTSSLISTIGTPTVLKETPIMVRAAIMLEDTTRTIREPIKGTSQGMAAMEARKEVVWQVAIMVAIMVVIMVGNISSIGVTHGTRLQGTICKLDPT